MQHFTVFGYARSEMNDQELRNMISMTLTCRIDKRYAAHMLPVPLLTCRRRSQSPEFVCILNVIMWALSDLSYWKGELRRQDGTVPEEVLLPVWAVQLGGGVCGVRQKAQRKRGNPNINLSLTGRLICKHVLVRRASSVSKYFIPLVDPTICHI